MTLIVFLKTQSEFQRKDRGSISWILLQLDLIEFRSSFHNTTHQLIYRNSFDQIHNYVKTEVARCQTNFFIH